MDTTQCLRWGSNPPPLYLTSSSLPLGHYAPHLGYVNTAWICLLKIGDNFLNCHQTKTCHHKNESLPKMRHFQWTEHIVFWMCSGAHWNFLIVFWCSLEFSHCVLMLIGIFSLCSGANWNCLIVFWCSLELSHVFWCSLELSHCVLMLIGIVSFLCLQWIPTTYVLLKITQLTMALGSQCFFSLKFLIWIQENSWTCVVSLSGALYRHCLVLALCPWARYFILIAYDWFNPGKYPYMTDKIVDFDVKH